MNRYRCHKTVSAVKITQIVHHAHPCPGVSVEEFAKTDAYEGAHLFGDDGVVYFVTSVWMHRHTPEIGGYYVVYDSGYSSFSPAEAFESGYARILAE